MLAVTVKLLHGTIRAGTPDGTVLAGGDTQGEWPPSPARIFSALAASGTEEYCAGTSNEELLWLESLDPPIIFASSAGDVLRSQLQSRFVVRDETCQGASQNYPARTSFEFRPGARLSPKNDAISYVWEKAIPSSRVLGKLRFRAARIGYLGCSDAPVCVSVSETLDISPELEWMPTTGTTGTILPVPYKGFLTELDRAFGFWRGGQGFNRSWIRSERVAYRQPSISAVSTNRETVWFRFSSSLPSRNLIRVTETLRDALLSQLQRLLPDQEIPAVIHGHRGKDEGGSQSDFLALVNVGDAHSTGRIFGAAISLPNDCDPALVQLVRTAALRLTDLTAPGLFKVSVSVYSGESKPWSAVPRRWTAASRRWVTATPVVFERWTKKVPDLKEVTRWCCNAGLPQTLHPVHTHFSRKPLIPGAIDLPPALIFRPGQDRRPFSHLSIEFDAEVEGPIVLGRGRQLGLGLFVPDRASKVTIDA